MDKNKSRVFDPFDRTAVGVMKDDIVSNRQNGHCGTSTLVVRLGVAWILHRSARRDFSSMRSQCINILPHDSNKVKTIASRESNKISFFTALSNCLLDVCSLFAPEESLSAYAKSQLKCSLSVSYPRATLAPPFHTQLWFPPHSCSNRSFFHLYPLRIQLRVESSIKVYVKVYNFKESLIILHRRNWGASSW